MTADGSLPARQPDTMAADGSLPAGQPDTLTADPPIRPPPS